MRVYLAIRLCAKVGTGARWARYGCGAVASGGHVRSVDRYRTSTGTAVCISCYAQSVDQHHSSHGFINITIITRVSRYF